MRWPEDYTFSVKNRAIAAIAIFYKNVGKKNINSYGEEEITKLIKENVKSISNINKTNLISDPGLNKWKGYGRVVIGKWHFAIDIKDNKVVVVDACHQQNMHNNKTLIELFEEDLKNYSDKVKNLTLPHTPGNPYFMRVELNDSCFYMKKISEENYFKCKDDDNFAHRLAERIFKDEIQYIDQSREQLESRGFKI